MEGKQQNRIINNGIWRVGYFASTAYTRYIRTSYTFLENTKTKTLNSNQELNANSITRSCKIIL